MTPCQAKTFITCECQNQKQALKCLASKTSTGNSKKNLECNDECLKVQRNAKLAAALKIDPASHIDDHVPYAADTLSLFARNQKFGQQYEREFRVFAADDKEKRLRFKPMQASQRAFLHALAEDFGFDSESQDPEPHRHVCIFKTPRFVSAPVKTLAQCAKLRAAPVPEASNSKPLVSSAEPWNAFLLGNPKFGITIDELYADLKPEFANAGIDFEISFLPSGDVVLKALAMGSWLLKMDRELAALKMSVAKKISSLGLASSTSLCAVDPSLNVLRQEDQNAASGGWSQVAKGGPAARGVVMPSLGAKSSFTVLGRRMKENEKKKVYEEAVDDWELEADAA
ncbi:NF-X1 type zinc finger protein [Diplocarpon rosae]|nr:NF-X1 type zinc finger protein [Diplocarpon rosae]